ncbi:unnamed protein product [Meganyctiphanes norvegica]|uniref:Uncharacterized protein n=1 Tax=Meganyctiphanes norvegica TaxID=48144 RepID=A0AAV2SQ52_MEGNR
MNYIMNLNRKEEEIEKLKEKNLRMIGEQKDRETRYRELENELRFKKEEAGKRNMIYVKELCRAESDIKKEKERIEKFKNATSKNEEDAKKREELIIEAYDRMKNKKIG